MNIHDLVQHLKVRVEFEDCDAMGVVYHPNFLRFIERARVDYLRRHHVPYAKIMEAGAGLVIAEVHSHYWRPAKFEDEIHVYTRQIGFTDRRLVLEQFITRESLPESALLLPVNRIPGRVFGATMTLASVKLATLRAAPLPPEIAAIMSKLSIEPRVSR